MSGKYDYLFKIVLLGETNVGKSSLLLQFTEKKFDEDQSNTIGVDFKVKFLESQSGHRIKTTIWDTAGQERFRTLTSSYYRGSHGMLIVFNTADLDSFEKLDSLLKEVENSMPEFKTVEKILIGNKIDLSSERKVSKEKAEIFAKSNGLLYFETSAKDDSINSVFALLVERILLNPQLNKLTKKEQEIKLDEDLSFLDSLQENCCLNNL